MKRFRLFHLAALCVSLAAAGSAMAAPSSADFVTKASEAGNFEIASSKLALQKSPSQDVKQFAQQMIDDHTKAAADLEKALNVSHADAEMSNGLDSSDQKTMAKLQNASGRDFDKIYIKAQTKGHKKAVKLFGDYAKNGDDQSLKAFAQQTLPVVEQHLNHVKQLNP